jgi:hypothetical protein
MLCAASKTVGETLDLDVGLAEVEQQTKRQPGDFQVVDALGAVSAVQALTAFSSTMTVPSTSRSTAYCPTATPS